MDYVNVVALADEELEKFSGCGRPKNGRVVLFFKDASLIADDDPVAVDFFLHVRVVTGPINAHQEAAISQTMHFQIFGRPVH